MSEMIAENKIKQLGEQMISLLGLSGSPVGVGLITAREFMRDEAEKLHRHRYCQALMKARHGASVTLDAEGIACPAAAAAFGFKPLPMGLQSGQGLVGFGIVSDAKVGEKMFQNMPKLESGRILQLHLFPLNKAQYLPDIVVVEDEVEKLMWIVLAYMHATGGERVTGTTAVLQATCVDSTVIPYRDKRLNFGYGCYGCRDATDIGPNEAVLGFPGYLLPTINAHLEFLAGKAIPTSRSKRALKMLQREESEKIPAGKENAMRHIGE
jgi:uncharacterized protein (DUF169 family)